MIDVPQENFVDINASCSDKFSARVNTDTTELHRPRRSESSEITVASRIERPHSSVERSRENDFTIWRVDDAGDGWRVLAESHEAEAGVDAP